MPDLFGIDIAGVIADEIEAAGDVLEGTLTKSTPGARTAGNLTGGTNPTTTTHTFKGFLERKTDERLADTLATTGGEFLTVLGATVDPVAEPEAGDAANIEQIDFEIIEIVDRDPAAATFRCLVKR